MERVEDLLPQAIEKDGLVLFYQGAQVTNQQTVLGDYLIYFTAEYSAGMPGGRLTQTVVGEGKNTKLATMRVRERIVLMGYKENHDAQQEPNWWGGTKVEAQEIIDALKPLPPVKKVIKIKVRDAN